MIFKKERCFVEKCFLTVYNIVCVFICFYQILQISEMYFAYKTITFVKYENISKISLPAITLCFEKHEVLRNKDLDQLLGTGKEVSKYLNNLTVKEQLTQLYNYQDIFEYCNVVNTIRQHNITIPYSNCSAINLAKRSIDYHRSVLNNRALTFIII